MDHQQSPRAGRRAQGGQNQRYGPAPTYGYGGGYGGGYGYGYGGYPDGGNGVERTLQDYVLMLRERIWYVLAALLMVFATTAVYTYTQVPVYQASSLVQIFRRAPTVMAMQQVTEISDVRSAEDLNTQVNLLKTRLLVERVDKRLAGEERDRFLAPYRDPKTGAMPAVAGVLESNRSVVPQRLSYNVAIQYRHPDPIVAAKVADLFADEYIAYNASQRVDYTMRAVVELQKNAENQKRVVNEIDRGLQEYRAKNNLVSLKESTDINTEMLKDLNSRVTQASTGMQEAETRWQQVQAARNANEDLLRLSFIAADGAVSQLQQEVASRTIALKELAVNYGARHPKMIEAQKAFAEAEAQLKRAIATTTAQIESSYLSAKQNLDLANRALAVQSNQSYDLDKARVAYSIMERDLAVAEAGLAATLKRMNETEVSASSNVETQNAQLVDTAKVPTSPVSPNVRLNLAMGLFGGLAVGISLAFLVGYIDDRAKSSYDIEGVIGLPLLAIVPKFKNAGQVDEKSGGAFAALKEPEIAEAFSTLYSSLRVKDESKNAKCIVVTSTIPGEGKSFISRNLAMTFASHGERVLLMDCDLRRPVAHRPFQVENLKGVIDICESENGVTPELIDSATIKGVQPGLDLMPSGGRSRSPAQNLSSKNFEVLLAELRKKYDRVFIDTPPVALVSDALVILPLADGSIYSIFFNKVRRKAAQFCARRILDINIPNFGAVLNGLDQNIGGYYYHHYYDQKYKDYYVTKDDKGARGNSPGVKPTSKS